MLPYLGSNTQRIGRAVAKAGTVGLYECAVKIVGIMLKSKGTGRKRSCVSRIVCDNAVCPKVVTVHEGNHNVEPTVDSQLGT